MNSDEHLSDTVADPPLKRLSVVVVVVNFNGAEWIRRCLDTLLNDAKTIPQPVTIVVVDNHSTDESLEILGEYRDRVRVEDLPRNVGFGAGNNHGVRVSSSDLVLLLNTDVAVPEGLLRTLIDELNERRLDALAAREVPYEGGAAEPVRVTIDPLGFPAFLDTDPTGPSFFLPAACVLLTRKMYEELGGFDENFFMYVEDVDFFWRARLRGFRFDYSRTAVIRHAVHGSSGGVGISLRRFVWRNTNQPMMLVKNYQGVTLLWIIPLYLAFQVVEMLGLIVMREPRAAWTYPKGLWKFATLAPAAWVQRGAVQRTRVVRDRDIFRLMYPGLAKVRSLRVYRSHRWGAK